MANNFNFAKLKKLKLYFHRFSWRQSLTFFIFLLLAIIFWGMQMFSKKIEIKKNIHLKYLNVGDDIIFDVPLVHSLEVNFKDDGSSVIKYLKKNKDTLDIDVNTFASADRSKGIIQSTELENMIKTKLLPSSELIGFMPTSLNLHYHKAKTKKVPVRFAGQLKFAVGYQEDGKIILKPDSVTIRGNTNTLDSIKYIYTVKDTLWDIKDSSDLTIKLATIHNVKIIPDNISLEVPTDQFILKSFQIPIHCTEMPENMSVRFFPSDVKVSFLIGRKKSDFINPNDFKISLKYSDLLKVNNSNTIHLEKIDHPKDIRIQSISPQDIEFILEQK